MVKHRHVHELALDVSEGLHQVVETIEQQIFGCIFVRTFRDDIDELAVRQR
jgi:hypothetical protein